MTLEQDWLTIPGIPGALEPRDLLRLVHPPGELACQVAVIPDARRQAGNRVHHDIGRQTDLVRLRADQEKWRSQMEAQARAINDKAGRAAVCIVPVGDAVNELRERVVAGEFPGGVWMVALAPVGEPSTVTAAIATALGITPQGDTPVIDTVAEAVEKARRGEIHDGKTVCALLRAAHRFGG